MKKTLLLAVMIASVQIVDGQINYGRQYELLSGSKNKEMVNSLLDNWEAAEPQNVAMLVEQFNRHIENVVAPAVGVSVEQPEGTDRYMTLTDSLGNTSGYIYEYYVTNDSLLTKAIDYVDRAIALAPDRSDLRMGKIMAYWIAGDGYFDRYTTEIYAFIDDLADKKRTWTYGETEPVSREELADAVQDYCADLFTLSTEDGYDAVETISKRLLKLFPKRAVGYSNLGSVAYCRGNLKEAEKFYRKGLRFDPDDPIVLRNMSVISNKLGKTENTLEYLGRLRRVGSDDDRAWADKFEKLLN